MGFVNAFKAKMAKQHPETVKPRPEEPHQPLLPPPTSDPKPFPKEMYDMLLLTPEEKHERDMAREAKAARTPWFRKAENAVVVDP